MNKTITVGSITIPLENIDYVQQGMNHSESSTIYLKTGKRIYCSFNEATEIIEALK